MNERSIPPIDVNASIGLASWNTSYITTDGFVCQLTLQGCSGSELLEKASSALAFILKQGSKAASRSSSNKSGQEKKGLCKSPVHGFASESEDGLSDEANVTWCSIHHCEMKYWTKNGRVWCSHHVNGIWCNGGQS